MVSLVRPDFAALSNSQYDLVVVGGGITGAGVAQDAASRGLKVLLLDQGDFAGGTSSKSSKLIHGGLRYLANMQFLTTWESIQERQLQQKLAPHMVWPVRFVMPLYSRQWLKNLKLRAGLVIYDLMAGLSLFSPYRHQKISAAKVLSYCPGVKAEGLVGGLVYYDCRTDDARHTLEVIKSAVEYGAQAANYARVIACLKDGEGRITGVKVRDRTGWHPGEYTIAAHCVVNATGVWMQKTTDLAGLSSSSRVVASKGIHITVSRERLSLESAVVIPSLHDKRFLVAAPWYDAVLIGTTDDAYEGDLNKPDISTEEVCYLLAAVNAAFPQACLTERDILASFAGLRPLVVSSNKRHTADLSRHHMLARTAPGMVSIAGGKLTTYRLMAKETVDLAIRDIKLQKPDLRPAACRTSRILLGGYGCSKEIQLVTESLQKRAVSLGLSAPTAAYLSSVYGARLAAILDLIESNPELAKPLVPEHPFVLAQVVYAVEQEAALTVADVLCRRMRLGILDCKAARQAAPKVAAMIAASLGWTGKMQADSLELFLHELE